MSNVEVFCSYARKDQILLNHLKAHLQPLQKQGIISVWNDTDITPGTNWADEIEKHLNTADIILLLVSASFLASDYCYGKEMKQAVERHKRGEAHVIPIILRPVYWEETPFGLLQALPTNAKPVIDWRSRDKAFLDITTNLRRVVEEIKAKLPLASTIVHSQRSRYLAYIPTTRGSKQALETHSHTQFKTDDQVVHNTFGEGVVLKSEMVQGTEYVDVQFHGRHGKKRLSMDFAKLEKY